MAIIPLNRVNLLIFVVEMYRVFCEAGTGH